MKPGRPRLRKNEKQTLLSIRESDIFQAMCFWIHDANSERFQLGKCSSRLKAKEVIMLDQSRMVEVKLSFLLEVLGPRLSVIWI